LLNLKCSFFWLFRNVTVFVTVVLGQPFLSILKDIEVKEESASRPQKMGPIRCAETSVTNQLGLCDNL